MRFYIHLAAAVVLLNLQNAVVAQTNDEPVAIAGPGLTQTATMDKSMAALAKSLLERGGMEGKKWDANQLFRLQLLTSQPESARQAIQEWRAQAKQRGQNNTGTLFVAYDLYARTLELQTQQKLSFEEAYKLAFRDVFAGLDDLQADDATFSLGTSAERLEVDLQRQLKEHAGKTALPVKDALNLSRQYLAWLVYSKINPLSPAMLKEDEQRRFITEELLIPTADGARISTLLIRPKGKDKNTDTKKYPTLMTFTIYADDNWSRADAKKMASHGYAGIVSFTRGKGRSPDAIVPYEHDGDDARAVIAWIEKQGWSDGRVGMYGGSYSAFTQWSVAKKIPKSLKAMAVSASAAPGVDIPAEGNVFMNFLYPWVPYVTNNKTLDNEAYGDEKRWQNLDKAWYQKGIAYRELDSIDGVANPVHRRWLQHPAYDQYWQAMIPYQQEFSAVNIPILSTTGYFDGAQVGALYYFQEHSRYLPNADHTLLIGPYSHFAMQAGIPANESGYTVEEVAKQDLQALRLQWLDHQFKGTPKPAILKDKVNYQVMGANIWKHAPSLAAMQSTHVDYYLGKPAQQNTSYSLLQKPDAKQPPLKLTVDMSKRDDVNQQESLPRVSKTLNSRNALAFVSDVLPQATEISGLFAGHLDFIVNKKDVDLNVTLFEQMPNGDYFELASYLGRASYAKDSSKRQLLQAGKRQTVNFTAKRITSRQMQAGSKIVIVVGIPKQADLQINYGSGKDVSDETIADAGAPIQLQLLNTSYIRIPLGQSGK
ncbi:CocE/NonD family hydrolase [Undibacterium pigrum]|uniref:Xaa-Pro dipeptidyl-peptidase C-terminal domain-containing protein n=1 Tax=Undibacterium pigrum TaxID=401470 RepID=A0A318IXE9_9BURK|nr:CocE/NonD family hydrolase [Undibacterium pigrum]PXX39995.1 hypothetical protein DFR42_109106 [Undibacterium pigrum]